MTDMSDALGRQFYARSTEVVAFELIGKKFCFQPNEDLLSGTIVETEAYLGSDDPASHAYRGVTPRNRIMFEDPGFSYVYFTYGFHHCLNVVTEEKGRPGAVLIRAIEPIDGIALMRQRRARSVLSELASGPGKLTQAFGINREHNGMDLTRSVMYIKNESPNVSLPHCIEATKRIGISEGKTSLFRFHLKGNPCVS